MSIPYLIPSTAATATHWTAIFQAADSLLSSALGGFSAVLAGVDKQWDRCFFFFDPSTTLPANLHPLARQFVINCSYGPPQQPAMFYRLYNDSPIATVVSGLSVTSTSSTLGVALVSSPTWSAWETAVYPNGFGSQSNGGLFAGTIPAVNILDASLKVWAVTVSSVVYAVTLQDVTTAEHAQPFKPADIFINAAFTWSSMWNKYTVVRIHNCASSPYTVTFGSASKTLNPGASLCVRKLSSGWVMSGNYFHWMESGDGRFLQCVEATGGAASIFKPGIVADVLSAIGYTNFGKYFDITRFWDLSPIYNNAAYSPTALEKTLPSGGYLPALTNSDLLGDLIVHRGQVLVANRLASPTRTQFAFTGFGASFATLVSALTAAGVSSRSISSTNLELYFSSTGAQDLIDLSSPLITFITGGNPAAYCGASQSSSPKSLVLPVFTIYATAVASNPTTTTLNYYNWAVDGSGNPYQAGEVTVTVQNAGSTASAGSSIFYADAAVSAVQSFIVSTAAGGGIISIANGTDGTNGTNVISTAFGPVLAWDEVWPLNAQFSSLPSLASSLITKVLYQQNIGLIVTRARFLADTTGVWPPRSSSGLLWNFPRVDQRYTFQRFFLHNTSDAPLMPDWASTFNGSDYAPQKYIATFGSYLWNDTLSLGEFVHVTSFYETTPISTDATIACSFSSTQAKTGLSRLGAFITGADNWPQFANWFNSAGSLTYPTYPDVSGGTVTISIATTGSSSTDWYSNNNNQILPSATANLPSLNIPGFEIYVPTWQNVLPCQVEHINLLASLVNAAPPMKWTLPGISTNYSTFTLNFAAADIIIINGGSGYSVGNNIGSLLNAGTTTLTLQVSSVDANGAITGLIDTGTPGYGFFSVPGPARPFLLPFSSGGTPAVIDTNSGSGTYNTYKLGFIPTYSPLGVQLPSGLSGTYWPRTAYFMWNGPSASGASDPIGTYLSALAAAADITITLQTSLPDGFGAALPENVFSMAIDGTVTQVVGDYAYGASPTWATGAQSYRWISIADARALYAALALPFVLNTIAQPMSWQVGTSNGSVTLTNNTVYPTNVEVGNVYGPVDDAHNTALGYSPTGVPGANKSYSSPQTPMDTMVGNDLGQATQVQAVFAQAAAGNWLTNWRGGNLCSPDSPLAPQPPDWTRFLTSGGSAGSNINYVNVGPASVGNSLGVDVWVDYSNYTAIRLSYATTFAIPSGWQDPDIHSPGLLALSHPVQLQTNATALVWLLEGLPAQLVAVIPQNFAYRDLAWAYNNAYVYLYLRGDNIVPIIVDNTVENDQAEITILPGTGGPGQYDHIITTALHNARLVTMPIDGQTGSQQSTGAGNTNGTGGL